MNAISADKHLEVKCDIDLHLMVTKRTSIYREMTKKDRFSKLLVIFQKTRLFKIPVQPPILQYSKGLLFFLIARP